MVDVSAATRASAQACAAHRSQFNPDAGSPTHLASGYFLAAIEGRDRAAGNLVGVEHGEGFGAWAAPGRRADLAVDDRGRGRGRGEQGAHERETGSSPPLYPLPWLGGRGHEDRGDVLSDGGRVRDGRHRAGPGHGPPRPRRALHLLRAAVPAGARASRRHLPRGDGAGLPALPVPAVLAGPRLADGRRRAHPRHRAAARALRDPPRDLGLPGPRDPGRRPAPGGDAARHRHHRGRGGPLVPADRPARHRAGRRGDRGERRPGPRDPRDPRHRPARSTSSPTSWT